MKTLWIAFRITLAFTLTCGVVYPLLVTGFAQAFYKDKAEGQIVTKDGVVVGSILIAQKFQRPEYFWPRPSAVDYNPLPSGGSNLGPTSQALKEAIASRPKELAFASGSGLDPHISPASAAAQTTRIAKERGLDEALVQKLILEHTNGRQWGLLGEPTVNVLALNLALDKVSGSH